jgi:N-acetylglutamate synthase/N-acetylornithine aminotransferase
MSRTVNNLARSTDRLQLVRQITVDGDTSTNDTVLGLASGAAGNAKITDPRSEDAAQLEAAVTALLQVPLAASC